MDEARRKTLLGWGVAGVGVALVVALVALLAVRGGDDDGGGAAS